MTAQCTDHYFTGVFLDGKRDKCRVQGEKGRHESTVRDNYTIMSQPDGTYMGFVPTEGTG